MVFSKNNFLLRITSKTDIEGLDLEGATHCCICTQVSALTETVNAF